MYILSIYYFMNSLIVLSIFSPSIKHRFLFLFFINLLLFGRRISILIRINMRIFTVDKLRKCLLRNHLLHLLCLLHLFHLFLLILLLLLIEFGLCQNVERWQVDFDQISVL